MEKAEDDGYVPAVPKHVAVAVVQQALRQISEYSGDSSVKITVGNLVAIKFCPSLSDRRYIVSAESHADAAFINMEEAIDKFCELIKDE